LGEIKMVFFLRNKDKKTIVDCEYYIHEGEYLEIRSVIDIMNYSDFLLEHLDRKEEIIKRFYELQELRGWLWESFFMEKQNTSEYYDEVFDILFKLFSDTADEFGLYFVTD
jgi:hypothetical protein